jgi:hypothetical protein
LLLLLLLQLCRHLLPPLPWRLALMRAAKAAISASSSSRCSSSAASPRELVAIAWGLTAAGVAFSKSFLERLLAAVAAQRSECCCLHVVDAACLHVTAAAAGMVLS